MFGRKRSKHSKKGWKGRRTRDRGMLLFHRDKDRRAKELDGAEKGTGIKPFTNRLSN